MTGRVIGKVLCVAAGTACALLHAATFLTVVPGLLILVPFFLLMGGERYANRILPGAA
jgi:hypothetical protein